MPSVGRQLAAVMVAFSVGQGLAQERTPGQDGQPRPERTARAQEIVEEEGRQVLPRAGENRSVADADSAALVIRPTAFASTDRPEPSSSAARRAADSDTPPRPRQPQPADEQTPSARKPSAPIPLDSESRAKRSPGPSPESPQTGWRNAASVAGSLGVVLGLFFVAAWVMRRGSVGVLPVLPTEVVEVLGRAPLAARQQVHLIRLGAKLVLVSASPAGIEPLSEVTEADEVQRLVGLCRQGHPSSATAAFRQVFSKFSGEPDRSGDWTSGITAGHVGRDSRSRYSDSLGEDADG